MIPKIIAHGGAWDWPDDLDVGKHEGLKEAIKVGHEVLLKGGSAIDAVETIVNVLEDNPVFDAGIGGYLNQEGQVQLDALIVDGKDINFGAVAGVTEIANPISLARKVMQQTDQCFFVGEGAHKQADLFGISRINNEELVTPAMREYFNHEKTDGLRDTVGALAIDANGNMAAATSTSGTPFKPVGRVGDSPLFGAGAYATNSIGAAGATGHGELIARALLSKVAIDKLEAGFNASEAANETASYIERMFPNSMSGLILIDKEGNLGASQTTPKLAFGWVDDIGVIKTAMQSSKLS